MRKLITSSLLISSFLLAQTPTQDNNKNKIERGWRYGNFADINNTKKSKRSVEDILEEQLKVQKEQLKVQKKMLAILEEQFDPKPKEIIVNGKKCIANSSAECFQYPLIAEAKRIPVMANWLRNPTVENAAKYQAWLSKWMGHVFEIGYSNSFARTQFGDKFYKRHFTDTGFIDGYGKNKSLEAKAQELAIRQLKDKIEIYIFLGQSSNIDSISLPALTEFYNKYSKYIDIGIIYESKDTQKKLLRIFKPIKEKGGMYVKNYQKIAGLLEVKKNVFYGKEFFEKFTIYATPTILVRLKKQNTAQSVAVGKMSVSTIEDRIISFLKFKKIIPDNYISNQKQFVVDTNDNYGKSSLYKKYFYDLNFSKQNIYNYSDTSKKDKDEVGK